MWVSQRPSYRLLPAERFLPHPHRGHGRDFVTLEEVFLRHVNRADREHVLPGRKRLNETVLVSGSIRGDDSGTPIVGIPDIRAGTSAASSFVCQ
jgi:hypothetical protein